MAKSRKSRARSVEEEAAKRSPSAARSVPPSALQRTAKRKRRRDEALPRAPAAAAAANSPMETNRKQPLPWTTGNYLHNASRFRFRFRVRVRVAQELPSALFKIMRTDQSPTAKRNSTGIRTDRRCGEYRRRGTPS